MAYYDFHIHSALSPCGDADMTPQNIVNMAALIGLDVIAVSDHNTVGNVKAVTEAAKEAGIVVIPAMEVETAEEVHILTLFPDYASAAYVSDEVYRHLPDILNRPDIFGEQWLMDARDNIIGKEEKLLISSTSLTVNTLYELMAEVGGLFVPAHVDRHSYSILTNLGFMPADIPVRWIEISKQVTDLSAYLGNRPELRAYQVLRNSDAHYLGDIAEKESTLAWDFGQGLDFWRQS